MKNIFSLSIFTNILHRIVWNNANGIGFFFLSLSIFVQYILKRGVSLLLVYGMDIWVESCKCSLKDGGINFDDKVVVILPCHVEC